MSLGGSIIPVKDVGIRRLFGNLHRTIIFPHGKFYMGNLPAILSFHQLKIVDAAMAEGGSEIKFISRPDNGQRAVDLDVAKNVPLIINICVWRTDIFYQVISACS